MTHNIEKFDEESRITRRTLLLGAGKALIGTVILGRLAYLGIFKSPEFQSLAEGNRVRLHMLLPQRGLIYDRNKKVLADNKQSFRLVIFPEDCNDISYNLKKVSALLEISPEDQAAILQTIKSKPRFIPTTIMENLTWKSVCQLEVHTLDLPGCSIEQVSVRHYPDAFSTAHVIGYVQVPSAEDCEENHLFRLNDFKLGKTGIEKVYDENLRGIAGYKQVEVNARNRMVRELSVSESQSGDHLHLCIDQDLQSYLAQRLQDYESAGAVVLDIHTGEALALHSHPSFDSNLFTHGIKKKDWQELVNNPHRPLHNKVIQGIYPPGSIFKSIVALAALEAGIVNAEHTTQCTGYIEISGHRFHCWKKEGHGHLELVHALRQSCDVYFYEIAQKLGIEKIAAMAKRFGFGSASGIELPGEKSGLVPTKSWKMIVKREKWRIGDTINAGIGQGALLATPLQLAIATAQLVHPKQKKVTPHLIKVNTYESDEFLDLNPAHLAVIKQGLDDTVNSPQGLAYSSRILTPGHEMGGKTSTAQVRRISMEERARGVLSNEQRPWEHRDHAMFAGYAPIHDPRFAVAVIIEHGGGGGKVAAPLGRDILIKAQELIG
jgi:penicillin-binding protein 2